MKYSKQFYSAHSRYLAYLAMNFIDKSKSCIINYLLVYSRLDCADRIIIFLP